MKFYVPDIGHRIQLSEDWTFNLHHESRNDGLHKALDPKYTHSWEHQRKEEPSREVTLPKGTVLKVDRIYIRKGAREYSSLTFYIGGGTDKNLLKKRFWAKLKDVNQIEWEEPSVGFVKPISIHWDYFGWNTLETPGIDDPFDTHHRSFKNSHEREIYGNDGNLDTTERIFMAKVVTKKRQAKQEEVDEWYDKWKKRNSRNLISGLLLSPKPKPEDVLYTTYSKYHLIFIETGEVIGEYTSSDALKSRARKFLKDKQKQTA